MKNPSYRVAGGVVLLTCAAFTNACSSEGSAGSTDSGGTSANSIGGTTSSVASGGTASSSPSSSGGVSTGGVATGGSSTTIVTTGGTSTGGASTGGASTGGVSTGGASTGGVSTGGASAGGVSTGGAGGTSNGGANTGGVEIPTGGRSSTGGTNTGGANTGGRGSTGGASGDPGGANAGGAETGGQGDGGAATGGSGPAECPAESSLASGDSNQSVQVDGMNRTYVLHIPPSYDGTTPMPVVIDFHPLGGTGQQQMSSNGWKSKADSVGFIMVYPNSYNSNNSWNAGMCCQDAQQNQVDDVAFTRAIVEQLKTDACIDPKRVYATGCSNGGGMTYMVACGAADIIAAAAPVDFRCVVGGSTSAPSCETCEPARPITVVHFDNTGDTSLVPYNGGMTSFPADCPPGQSCTGMGFPSAADNFSTWQEIDGCTGAAMPASGHSECQTNSSCEGDAQVSMCVQQGGSHCGNYSSLEIVDIAWEMFQNASLP